MRLITIWPTVALTYPVINDQFVHPARPEGGAHSIHHRHACVDVADQLWLALARVRALPQQDDLWLLRQARGAVMSGTRKHRAL